MYQLCFNRPGREKIIHFVFLSELFILLRLEPTNWRVLRQAVPVLQPVWTGCPASWY